MSRLAGSKNGEDVHSKYSFTSIIAQSPYATVHAGVRKQDGQQVAIKEVKMDSLPPEHHQHALDEARTLSKFKHANIIRYYESFLSAGSLYIVTELADGGDLATLIATRARQQKPLSEDQIMLWLVQLLISVWSLHSKQVVHRDLSSHNVFLARGNLLKLGDFGNAAMFSAADGGLAVPAGTAYHLCPEVCEGQPYSSKSDMWALGVILFEVTTLQCVFNGSSLPSVAVKILRGRVPPIPSRFSANLRNLTHSMLSTDSSARPSADDVLRLGWVRRHAQRYAELLKKMSSDLEGWKPLGLEVALDPSGGTRVATAKGLRLRPSRSMSASGRSGEDAHEGGPEVGKAKRAGGMGGRLSAKGSAHEGESKVDRHSRRYSDSRVMMRPAPSSIAPGADDKPGLDSVQSGASTPQRAAAGDTVVGKGSPTVDPRLLMGSPNVSDQFNMDLSSLSSVTSFPGAPAEDPEPPPVVIMTAPPAPSATSSPSRIPPQQSTLSATQSAIMDAVRIPPRPAGSVAAVSAAAFATGSDSNAAGRPGLGTVRTRARDPSPIGGSEQPRSAHAFARDKRKDDAQAMGQNLVSNAWLEGNLRQLDQLQGALRASSPMASPRTLRSSGVTPGGSPQKVPPPAPPAPSGHRPSLNGANGQPAAHGARSPGSATPVHALTKGSAFSEADDGPVESPAPALRSQLPRSPARLDSRPSSERGYVSEGDDTPVADIHIEPLHHVHTHKGHVRSSSLDPMGWRAGAGRNGVRRESGDSPTKLHLGGKAGSANLSGIPSKKTMLTRKKPVSGRLGQRFPSSSLAASTSAASKVDDDSGSPSAPLPQQPAPPQPQQQRPEPQRPARPRIQRQDLRRMGEDFAARSQNLMQDRDVAACSAAAFVVDPASAGPSPGEDLVLRGGGRNGGSSARGDGDAEGGAEVRGRPRGGGHKVPRSEPLRRRWSEQGAVPSSPLLTVAAVSSPGEHEATGAREGSAAEVAKPWLQRRTGRPSVPDVEIFLPVADPPSALAAGVEARGDASGRGGVSTMQRHSQGGVDVGGPRELTRMSRSAIDPVAVSELGLNAEGQRMQSDALQVQLQSMDTMDALLTGSQDGASRLPSGASRVQSGVDALLSDMPDFIMATAGVSDVDGIMSTGASDGGGVESAVRRQQRASTSATKAAELRGSLEAQLGEDRLQAAYQYVQQMDGNDQDREVQQQLEKLLEPDTHLAYSIYRLVTLEALVYD